MADTGKTTRHAEQLRARIAAQAGLPVIPSIYESGSLTEGVSQGIKNYQKTALNEAKATFERSPDTSAALAEQRAGEREDMTQFGDDKEKLGAAMSRSLGGSKTFTKSEVRRGYRRLG